MELNIWNLIYLILTGASLGIHLAKHGEQRSDKYNFWNYLIASSIIIFVLYKGGFFN